MNHLIAQINIKPNTIANNKLVTLNAIQLNGIAMYIDKVLNINEWIK